MTWTIVTDENNAWTVETVDVYVESEYVVADYVEGNEQVWTKQADKDTAWQS